MISGLSVLLLSSTASLQALQAPNASEQLQAAVSKGHRLGAEGRGVAAVEALLDQGLDVNARDNVGWTALMMASLEGLPSVVDTLLRRRADPNLRSAKGETALVLAAGCFIVRTRASLVEERGFGPEMRERQLAAPSGMVDLLLRSGADVNAATADGRTPLMMAAMHGWTDVVQRLLDAKADVRAKDQAERVAIDYARPTDTAILQTLRRAGAPEGSGRSGRAVCDAQEALNRLGLRTGPADCWWGTATADQLRKFQALRGLPETGELDSATIRALEARP